MDKKAIFEKAITKAIANGWDSLDVTDWWQAYYMKSGPARLAVEFRPAANAMGIFYEWPVIIYNHDFAKALWGEEVDVSLALSGMDTTIPWEYHLQQMVIANDPIEYLGANI